MELSTSKTTSKLWNQTKRNASHSKKKKEFLLTLEDVRNLYDNNKCCTISGINLTMLGYQNEGINIYNMSIDRINSDKGYTIDNIQSVCAIINFMKSDSTNNFFINMCNTIGSFNSDKILNIINHVD